MEQQETVKHKGEWVQDSTKFQTEAKAERNVHEETSAASQSEIAKTTTQEKVAVSQEVNFRKLEETPEWAATELATEGRETRLDRDSEYLLSEQEAMAQRILKWQKEEVTELESEWPVYNQGKQLFEVSETIQSMRLPETFQNQVSSVPYDKQIPTGASFTTSQTAYGVDVQEDVKATPSNEAVRAVHIHTPDEIASAAHTISHKSCLSSEVTTAKEAMSQEARSVQKHAPSNLSTLPAEEQKIAAPAKPFRQPVPAVKEAEEELLTEEYAMLVDKAGLQHFQYEVKEEDRTKDEVEPSRDGTQKRLQRDTASKVTRNIGVNESGLADSKTDTIMNVPLDEGVLSVESKCLSEKSSKNGQPPVCVKELSSLKVNIGEMSEFCCQFQGEPVPTVSWLKDGQPLAHIPDYDIVTKSNYSKLTVFYPTTDHVGTYECVLANKYVEETSVNLEKAKEDKIKHKFTFAFDVAAEAPNVIRELKNMACSNGNTAVLECVISGEPTPEVTWYFDDVCICSAIDKYIMEVNEKTCRLYIKNFAHSDAGVYKCVATNKIGKVSSISNVSYRAAEPKQFYKEGKMIQVEEIEGGSLSEDRTSADKSTTPIKPERQKLSATSLKHSAAVDEEMDVPTSLESNFEEMGITGKAEENEDLDNQVRLIPEPSLDSGVFLSLPESQVDVTEAIEVLGHEAQTEVKEDNVSCITAQSKHIKGDVTTLIDGPHKPVEENVSLTIEAHTALGDKDIDEYLPSPADETVEASHSEMTMEETRYLSGRSSLGFGSLQEKVQGIPPAFLKPLIKKRVFENDSLRFYAEVFGLPSPDVKWFCNKSQLAESSRIIMDRDGDSISLTISNVTKADQGEYICEALNYVGEARSVALVVVVSQEVRFMPAPPAVTHQHVMEFDVEEDDSSRTPSPQEILLEVELDEKDVKEFEKLVANTDKETSEQGEKYVSINFDVFAEPAKDEKIEFKGKSSDMCSFHFQVTETAPKFVIPLTNVTAAVSSPVILQCLVSGKPNTTAEWYKDGELVTDSRCIIQEKTAGHFNLLITNVTLSDAGEYKCLIQNSNRKVCIS
uniref:Ig-like domain-containing protein n=1 Tax=Neogobius melanostomus TaxID=47308 RepID=A0A8C6U6I5_9GOBI